MPRCLDASMPRCLDAQAGSEVIEALLQERGQQEKSKELERPRKLLGIEAKPWIAKRWDIPFKWIEAAALFIPCILSDTFFSQEFRCDSSALTHVALLDVPKHAPSMFVTYLLLQPLFH